MSTSQVVAADDSAKIVRIWKLASFEQEWQRTSEREATVEKNLTGYIIFTPEGRMMVIMTTEGRMPPKLIRIAPTFLIPSQLTRACTALKEISRYPRLMFLGSLHVSTLSRYVFSSSMATGCRLSQCGCKTSSIYRREWRGVLLRLIELLEKQAIDPENRRRRRPCQIE